MKHLYKLGPKPRVVINLHFPGISETTSPRNILPTARPNTNWVKPPLSQPAFLRCLLQSTLSHTRRLPSTGLGAVHVCGCVILLVRISNGLSPLLGSITNGVTGILILRASQIDPSLLHSSPIPMDTPGLSIVRPLLFQQFLSALNLLPLPRLIGTKFTYPWRSLTKSLIVSTPMRAASGIAPWSANLGPPVAGEISSIV